MTTSLIKIIKTIVGKTGGKEHSLVKESKRTYRQQPSPEALRDTSPMRRTQTRNEIKKQHR